MAVVNLTLSALNMETLPEAYEKIIEAINERKTILNAFNIDTSYSQDWSRYTGSYGFVAQHQPNYAMCMNSLMYCVHRMGQYFTDLSGEYIEDSYANFPKTFSSVLRSDTEHNIGVSIPQFDSFAEVTIDTWKSVLSTAAYWLNRYTALNVPNNFRTVTQTCDMPAMDLSATSAFVAEDSNEIKRDMSFDIRHDSYEYYRPTNSGTDHYTGGTRRYYGDFGLALDNRTPYPATVLLYLCLPSVNDSSWSNDHKWQNYTYEMEIYSNLWNPDPDDPQMLYPGEGNIYKDDFVLAGGQWRQTIDSRTWVKYSAGSDSGSDNFQLCSTNDSTKKNYTHDGSQSIVLEELSSEEGEDRSVYYYAWADNQLDMHRYRVWDGLGMWTSPSEPLTAEVLPARTKKKIAATVFTNLPEPSKSRLREIVPSGWQKGGCWWQEEFYNQYDLRVVPILDFTDSITTFSGI